MRNLKVMDIEEIADFMMNKIISGRNSITFACSYEDAAIVLKGLLEFEDTIPFHICLEPSNYDGYYREFLLTLDDDFNVWCFKAYREDANKYWNLTGCNSVVLFDSMCNKELVNSIAGDVDCYIIYPSLEEIPTEEYYKGINSVLDDNDLVEESNSNSEYTHISRTKDGKLAGFSKSWSNTDENGFSYYSSFSHYGSNEESVKKIARDFGVNV